MKRRPRNSPTVAMVQDHVAQRGGAERVALSLLKALGTNTLHTAVYAPERTYPEFADIDVRPRFFSRFPFIRSDHRMAFPFMAPGFSLRRSLGDIVVAASAGWSHGTRSSGRKIVYWYTPPRWIYQQSEYLSASGWVTAAVRAATPALRRWDRRAVRTVDRHLAVSNEIANRLRRIYGVEAEVIHPPITLDEKPQPVPDLEPGYLLVVSRLLSYKNVQVLAQAMSELPEQRLVIVGSGPYENEVARRSPANVRLVGSVSDGELCWLYQNCSLLLAAAYEDFGLTPLEAASFGRPTVALRAGGYLDTIEEGLTGHFFNTLAVDDIIEAIEKTLAGNWNSAILRAHASRFSEAEFIRRIESIVDEERDHLL